MSSLCIAQMVFWSPERYKISFRTENASYDFNAFLTNSFKNSFQLYCRVVEQTRLYLMTISFSFSNSSQTFFFFFCLMLLLLLLNEVTLCLCVIRVLTIPWIFVILNCILCVTLYIIKIWGVSATIMRHTNYKKKCLNNSFNDLNTCHSFK